MFWNRNKETETQPDASGPAPTGHGHTHGAIDQEVLSSGRGIWATKISLAVLLATALAQIVIFVFTGSVALLADTIHSFGDGQPRLYRCGPLSRSHAARRPAGLPTDWAVPKTWLASSSCWPF